MSAPGKQWLLFWIIIREVILWQTNGQALMEVAPILLCKCVAIIFKMTGYKNLVEISCGEKCRTAGKALRKYGKLGVVYQS